jgi:hypothetical protein
VENAYLSKILLVERCQGSKSPLLAPRAREKWGTLPWSLQKSAAFTYVYTAKSQVICGWAEYGKDAKIERSWL